ncbi:hypothetical protein ADEAN_000405000 [Angomonas deanei]|uniref:Uncharacterized protein n=1 Tax=Angomonas deanei TaxID=59799 RepID=A0A7G2C9Y7_9TRYP|nr:hypothetical protein ADEAN_000405000 [Angomonas deanei]
MGMPEKTLKSLGGVSFLFASVVVSVVVLCTVLTVGFSLGISVRRTVEKEETSAFLHRLPDLVRYLISLLYSLADPQLYASISASNVLLFVMHALLTGLIILVDFLLKEVIIKRRLIQRAKLPPLELVHHYNNKYEMALNSSHLLTINHKVKRKR